MLVTKTVESKDVKWEFAVGKGYAIRCIRLDSIDTIYYFDELTAEGVWWDICFDIQSKEAA